MTTAAPQVDIIPSNERLNKVMTTTPYNNINDGVGKTELKNGVSSHSQPSFGEFHLNCNMNGYPNNFSGNNARNQHNNYQPQIKSRQIINQSKQLTFHDVYHQSAPTNCTVYIGGIMNGLNEDVLRQKFIQYGRIVDMKVFKDRGFGFIKFLDKYSATRAIMEVNSTEFRGQIVRCSWGKNCPSDTLSHGPKSLSNGSPHYSNNTSLPAIASSAPAISMNVNMSPVIYHGQHNHNYNQANHHNVGNSEKPPPTSQATNSTFQQLGPGAHHAPAFAYPNPSAYQYNPRSVFPYHIHPAIPYHPQATAPLGYWLTAPHGYHAIGQVPSPSTGMTPMGSPYWFPPAQQIYPSQNPSQATMPLNSSNVHLPE